MTKFICPQISPTLPTPIGIQNESTRTIAHAFNSFGLSRDGSLPKALHEGGKPDEDLTKHFIQYPGGKKLDLVFDPGFLSKDRPALKCFEAAIGFDRKHYETKKASVDQSTPLARFYQDQILEVWDPILETKTKAKDSSPVVYKDLLKFWEQGIGDANTATLNLAALRGILEHIENPNAFVTVEKLITDHDRGISLSLTKGALACRPAAMPHKFYQSDKAEYQLACEKPAAPNAALDSFGFEGYTAISHEDYAALTQKPPESKTGLYVAGGTAALAGLVLGAGLSALLRRRGSTKEAARNDAPKVEVKAPQVKAPSAVPKAVAPKDDDTMDDVLADLDQARRNQSPASSPGASAKPASVVTQENVIIKGDKAEPVPGVDREVVHAQVLLHARRFLQPSVREALEKGRSLPEGGELSDGTFAREIGEIVERIIAETYQKKALPDGAEILADLWKAQREERGYLVRRGAPQRMIIEILNDYIREHASKVGSPFAGGVGASLIEEVERHAGENSFFEKGLPEIFRQICK